MRSRVRLLVATAGTALALGLSPLALGDADVQAPPVNNADFEIGSNAIKASDWSRAVYHLNIAAGAEPTNADVQNLLGFAYRKERKLELAFKHYREALRLDPAHRGAHEYIGEAYLLAGDKARAQQHLATLEKLCGKGCEEYQDLARAITAAK